MIPLMIAAAVANPAEYYQARNNEIKSRGENMLKIAKARLEWELDTCNACDSIYAKERCEENAIAEFYVQVQETIAGMLIDKSNAQLEHLASRRDGAQCSAERDNYQTAFELCMNVLASQRVRWERENPSLKQHELWNSVAHSTRQRLEDQRRRIKQYKCDRR